MAQIGRQEWGKIRALVVFSVMALWCKERTSRHIHKNMCLSELVLSLRQRDMNCHVKRKRTMEQNHKKYAAFLTRLQEELMTAATQHSVAWRFGNWTARQRLLLVHERLLRDVRRNLQKLNNHVINEAPDFRRAFGAEFQRWANQLPEPAKEQLSLLKEYTEVFAEPKRK